MDTAITVRERRRVRVRWIVLGLVAILVLCAVWVVVRALIARDQLVGAIPLASEIRTSVLDGQTGGLDESISELRSRADTAADLTSDPIWRVAELVPIVGQNLTAFREAAAVIRDVADEALPELSELASTVTIDSFGIVDGRIDLAPILEAAPHIAAASTALDRAAEAAARIDSTGTIPQVGESVDQLVDLVTETRDLIGSLDTAVTLLPPMLGSEGPRDYLLLAVNNAELRAIGGIPGALAVVRFDDGAISVTGTGTAREIGELAEPLDEPTAEEAALYGDELVRYAQNVTATPDFSRAAELSREMWFRHTGESVDGVIALDPVALGYVLNVVGSVDAGGVSLDGSTTAQFLLNQVYLSFPDSEQQDGFFRDVIGQVLAALTTSTYDRSALIDALVHANEEGRISVWSSDTDEQQLLASTPLAGGLPTTDEDTSTFAVYLNDGTGAKMDYYLGLGIDVASGECGVPAVPTFDVTAELSSFAPDDAATSLPIDITGGGLFGVPAGTIATNVYIYAPQGFVATSILVDGRERPFRDVVHEGRTVIALTVDLVPGQTARAVARFEGTPGASTKVLVEHTPLASPVDTTLNGYLDCAG